VPATSGPELDGPAITVRAAGSEAVRPGSPPTIVHDVTFGSARLAGTEYAYNAPKRPFATKRRLSGTTRSGATISSDPSRSRSAATAAPAAPAPVASGQPLGTPPCPFSAARMPEPFSATTSE
jgi:hypothetical protein